jgi:hypothetical protein
MKKNKDIEEAEFIKAIGKCIFQVLVPFDVVSSRFVSGLVLFDCDDVDTLETLALVVARRLVKRW